jgi:histidyl-tRNA synthetase
MANLIEPRTLKGFRDFPPELMIPREQLLEKTRQVYRSYGFLPIDTPALEYAEVLLGNVDADSEVQKIIYRFQDHGGRDVALRFDLTVPFARFAAQHIEQLGTPFKRYHMGPVWRGENTGHGRYREFWQCDFDTIGTTSNAADIEVALVINDLLTAIGFERFEIRVNSRLVLNGFLEVKGLADKAGTLLRSLDKLSKIGHAKVAEEMRLEAGVTHDIAEAVLYLAEIPEATGADVSGKVLNRLADFFSQTPNEKATEGIIRLRELLSVTKKAGVPEERIRIDPSICRGLDYYTGTVFETFLLDLPSIGSVCSGGRYDNLAGVFTKRQLPGVGASLGLDRLLAAMEELKMLEQTGGAVPVLIVQFEASRLGEYHGLGRQLRAQGIGAEVYPEAKKLGQQLQYAERWGFRVALIAGPDEFAKGLWKIKDLARRQEISVPESQVVEAIWKVLRSEEIKNSSSNEHE